MNNPSKPRVNLQNKRSDFRAVTLIKTVFFIVICVLSTDWETHMAGDARTVTAPLRNRRAGLTVICQLIQPKKKSGLLKWTHKSSQLQHGPLMATIFEVFAMLKSAKNNSCKLVVSTVNVTSFRVQAKTRYDSCFCDDSWSYFTLFLFKFLVSVWISPKENNVIVLRYEWETHLPGTFAFLFQKLILLSVAILG